MFSQCLENVLPQLASLECRAIAIDQLEATLATLLSAPHPDLLVLDAMVDTEHSNAVIDFLRSRLPSCKVLLIIPPSATERIASIAQLGSQGCVCEDIPLAELCAAIRTVLEGKTYCSPHLANALFFQLGRSDRNHHWSHFVDDVRLTEREREVLCLIAWEHLSNKQIARRLHVSLYTVKNHVHNLIEKLGVEGRNEAAMLAKRRNLLGSQMPAIIENR